MPPPVDLQAAVLTLLDRIEIDASVEAAIRAWGAKATDVLRQVVRGAIEAGPYQRSNAAYLLGLLKPPKADADLSHALAHDTSQSVRLSSLDALGRLDGPIARARILDLVTGAGVAPTERLHAAAWLARIGRQDDAKVLEGMAVAPEDVLMARLRDSAVQVIRDRRDPDAPDGAEPAGVAE